MAKVANQEKTAKISSSSTMNKHSTRSRNMASLTKAAAHHKITKAGRSTDKNKQPTQHIDTSSIWRNRRLAVLSVQARQNLMKMRARDRALSKSVQQTTARRHPASDQAGAGWNSLPPELRNTIYHYALVVPEAERVQIQFDGKIDLRSGLLQLDRRTRKEVSTIVAGATKIIVCGDNWREEMRAVSLDALKEVEVTWSKPNGPWKELGPLASHLAGADNLEHLRLRFYAWLERPAGPGRGAEQLAEALRPWAQAVHNRLETSNKGKTVTGQRRLPWGQHYDVEYSMTAVNLLEFRVEERLFYAQEWIANKWCKKIQHKLREEFPSEDGPRFGLDCGSNGFRGE
ncbi:hypothetical protein Slin15195_G029700 [Septoria linicola]|uniref:Uncharacterized protein n=1 Tax=Septoria linicola TaxID=215465 RepID=A0A9Q9EFC9_9PEZI|nr:hypothetical protein Slin14017_G028730 [Septoria linicola]USW49651.1 hypothetical protein Slin15195_G029700 [Septoria linicola]